MAPIIIVRSRTRLGVGVVAVIALGLASRKFRWLLPVVLGKYPGDALWALMVFLGWAFLKPQASTRFLAVVALATAFGVECSQQYQAPWLNQLRSTTIGHLVLGSTFSWIDMAAYTVGISIGAALDVLRPADAGRVPSAGG